MRFYPCVPTRRVGGRKGLRLAISDLVTVSVEPGGKRIPIDALPVAARRVLHHEASGDHERVDMPSLQASDDPACQVAVPAWRKRIGFCAPFGNFSMAVG